MKNSNKSKYVDPKDCQDCGALCCKSLTIPFDKKMDRVMLSVTERLADLDGALISTYETKSHINVVFHYSCQHLNPDLSCSIYEEGRPLLCRTYPGKHDDLCPMYIKKVNHKL